MLRGRQPRYLDWVDEDEEDHDEYDINPGVVVASSGSSEDVSSYEGYTGTTSTRNKQHSPMPQQQHTNTTTAPPTTTEQNSSDHPIPYQTTTWRGDPMVTGSDWSIHVVTNELKTITYHVHYNILVKGSRKSKYLARLMKENHKKLMNSSSLVNDRRGGSRSPVRQRRRQREEENQSIYSSTSSTTSSTTTIKTYPTMKIDLDERDSKNFPLVLDYMYASRSVDPKSCCSGNDTVTTVDSILSFQSTTESTIIPIHVESKSFDHRTFGTTSVTTSTPTDTKSHKNMDGSTIINTYNAVSIRNLAKTFEIDSLLSTVNKFIQTNLHFRNAPYYLTKAVEYSDERLIESALRLCTDNILRVDKKAFMKLPFPVFKMIVKSFESLNSIPDDEIQIQVSLLLSEIICRYMEHNTKIRTVEILLEFTDPLLIPYLASEAAIGYTAIIKQLPPYDMAKYWTPLIELSKRCAQSVVKEYGWSDFSVSAAVNEYLRTVVASQDKENSHRHHPHDQTNTSSTSTNKIDSLLFATSFAAALEQAQDDHEEMHQEQERLQELINVLQDTFTNIERVIHKKDEQLERQQHALHHANETIAHLKAEIGEYVRQQKMEYSKNYSSPQPPPPTSVIPHQLNPPWRPCRSTSRSPLRLQQQQATVATSSSPYIDRSRRELISPTRVGMEVYMNKQKSRDHFRTRSEMRTKSLLSTP